MKAQAACLLHNQHVAASRDDLSILYRAYSIRIMWRHRLAYAKRIIARPIAGLLVASNKTHRQIQREKAARHRLLQMAGGRRKLLSPALTIAAIGNAEAAYIQLRSRRHFEAH